MFLGWVVSIEPPYIWMFMGARVGWTDKSICHSWTPLTVNKKGKKHRNGQKKHLNQFRKNKQETKGAGVLWFRGVFWLPNFGWLSAKNSLDDEIATSNQPINLTNIW